jgi:hypothetical protein
MAGRGRGRGRAPTAGRSVLMETAKECGYDQQNIRAIQALTRPQLFPDLLLHSSGDNKLLQSMDDQQQQQQQQLQSGNGVKPEGGASASSSSSTQHKKLSGTKRIAQALFLITKGREIHHRIQNSAFHVKAKKDVPDVIRHSESTKPTTPEIDASTVLSHCLKVKKRTATGYYIPEELVSGQKLGSSSAISGGIEASIAAGRAVSLNDISTRPRLDSVDNANGGEIEEEVHSEGSEDDGEDYCADYYASDAEDSGGGDNELTF